MKDNLSPSSSSFNSTSSPVGAQRAVAYTSPSRPAPRTSQKVMKARPRLNDNDFEDRMPGQKSNLNHLLNFSFPARPTPPLPMRKSVQQQHYSKDRFIQSIFRFVLKPLHSVTILTPDYVIPWDQIQSLILPATLNLITCPICLSPPIAARATKCGHNFCYHCIYHCLSLSATTWVKCPLCFDFIYLLALKPLSFHFTIPPVLSLSPIVDFVLMKRDMDSTVSLPVPSHRKCKASIPSVEYDVAKMFSKVMNGTNAYLRETLKRDIDELRTVMLESPEETVFIETCIEMITVDLAALKDDIPLKAGGTKPVSGTPYHFYQASDGSSLFLHPLDIKILRHIHGAYSNFPLTVSLPIQSIHLSTMTIDVRKRVKYLGVALGGDVSFGEVNWNDIADEDTLAVFEKELKERQRKLDKQAKESRKEVKESRKGKEVIQGYINDDYNIEDFGSDEIVEATELSSKMSFATITATKWVAEEADESSGWKLEIPFDTLDQSQESKGKKKKKKGVLLVGNGGSRGRS